MDVKESIINSVREAEAREAKISESLTNEYLGPGVSIWLGETSDGSGHEIKIAGSFRSGGLSEEQILNKLREVWKTIDIDV
jgi:hypothetical protein